MALFKNIIMDAFIPVAQVSYKRVPYQDQPEHEDPNYTRRLQEVLFNIILTHSCNATNLEIHRDTAPWHRRVQKRSVPVILSLTLLWWPAPPQALALALLV
jgi:hypothetical protein